MEESSMKLAVLSGKGGTGKTLVAVNLANVATEAIYLDCDVEEPNGHLFFKSSQVQTQEVKVKIPQIKQELCSGCRRCVNFCKFNALAFIGKKVKVFESICHSCGGCSLFCPSQAIIEVDKTIGRIETGKYKNVEVNSGFLNIGEASGVPIIKQLLHKNLKKNKVVVVDCPPGSACVVMESIREADYCILVAEPTIFGVHNLAMVHELVEVFQKKFAVVLNKCLVGINPAEEYCVQNNLKILAKIPFDKILGKANSEGEIISNDNSSYQELFKNLLNSIKQEVVRLEDERTISS